MKRSSFKNLSAFLFTAIIPFASCVLAENDCCKKDSCDKIETVNTYALTGDWGGYRTTLRKQGVEIAGNYTGEIFGNPTGGKKHGSVFDGLLKLSIDVDLEKAMDLPAATFRISGLYPHGTSGSSQNVGDASIFSNIDSFDTYRLVDLWVEQKLSGDKLSLKLGQMRVDDEFGITDSAALFINSTFGVPNPPSTPMPMGIYPLGALGARIRFEPVKGAYGLFGIYDGNPSSGDFGGHAKRHGTDWALRSSEGALYIGEAGYQRAGCAYPGALRLGLLHHTMDFADVRSNHSGEVHGSSTSAYYVVDQTCWQNSKDSKESVSVFLRGTLAEQSTSYMSESMQVGAVYSGLAGGGDKLGLAFARNKFSPGQEAFGSESVAELSYQVPVLSGLRLQPDVQYISRPGGSDQSRNAWVIGLRAIFEF